MHWWIMAVSIAVLALLGILTLRSPESSTAAADTPGAEKRSDAVFVTQTDWQLRQVLRTPQYFIIVAALTMTLFGGVTTNTWAVTHMGNLGIPVAIAAGALSTHALINAFSRAFGGALATWLDPKWLLASALMAEIIGMIALSVADNPIAIAVFVVGEGYGFGMCLFATTMLLVNYYGPKEAPKTMGTMHLITTIAMLGPVLGGYVADTYGSFAGVFQAYAVVMLGCLLAVALMQPPRLPRGCRGHGLMPSRVLSRPNGVVAACTVGNAVGITPMVYTVFSLFLIPISTDFGWAPVSRVNRAVVHRRRRCAQLPNYRPHHRSPRGAPGDPLRQSAVCGIRGPRGRDDSESLRLLLDFHAHRDRRGDPQLGDVHQGYRRVVRSLSRFRAGVRWRRRATARVLPSRRYLPVSCSAPSAGGVPTWVWRRRSC